MRRRSPAALAPVVHRPAPDKEQLDSQNLPGDVRGPGGFFLVVPTWPALVVFLGTYVGIRGAIGAEEGYLRQAYGDDYLAYATR
jgi:hypothetical protein